MHNLAPRPYPGNVAENALIKENRIGVFLASVDLLRALPDDLLRRVFSHFMIVRAEALFDNASIRYCAYSPLFAQVEEKDEPPSYEITVTGEGADLTVEARSNAAWDK